MLALLAMLNAGQLPGAMPIDIMSSPAGDGWSARATPNMPAPREEDVDAAVALLKDAQVAGVIKVELPRENADIVKEAFSSCQTLVVRFACSSIKQTD